MKVSKKAYYGLRAMVYLAASKKAVSARVLSESEHIPEDFLEKILQKLRAKGVVESKKGVEGGYTLARKPDAITVWEIFETLDGPMRLFPPPSGNTLPCNTLSHCQTNAVWRILEKEIKETLSSITLKQLMKHL